MSLLLDALKRAEEAKRAKQDSVGAPGASPAKPAATTPSPALSLDELTWSPAAVPAATPAAAEPADLSDAHSGLALEELPAANMPAVSAQVASAHAALVKSRQTATPAPAETLASRETVHNVFAAKLAGDETARVGNKWLLPVIAVVVAAIAVGGWYVWNEVGRINKPTAPGPLGRAAPPASPALPQLPPATGQLAAAPAPAKPAATEAPLPPLLPAQVEQAPLTKVAMILPAGPPLSPRERLAKSIKEAPVAGDSLPALRLTSGVTTSPVSPDLSRAYAALSGGDYPGARTLYTALVQAEPLSIDAQLGLAAAAARLGELQLAATHYRAALTIDPRNDVAIAGLVTIDGGANQGNAETLLRSLIAQHANAAPLQFALGNTLAAQRRWGEAQQAYFDAFRLEPEHADYVYNLAVSLDHLNQARLARQYYQQAIALSGRGGGQFDKAAVARRLQELAGDAKLN